MNINEMHEELLDLARGQNACAAILARVIPANTYQGVTFGVIDAEARYRFTNGWCGSLAAAICEETGWRCVIICPTYHEEGAKPWVTIHVVAVDPQNIAVDIEGARPLDDMITDWECRVGGDLVEYPTTADEMMRHFRYSCPQTIAKHFVQPCLEQYRRYLNMKED